jgi:hypothetical protein
MALGKKTGGREKGTPNKPNPLKEHLRSRSINYFVTPVILVEDEQIAERLGVEVGSKVPRADIDEMAMEPKDRAAWHEKLLRYHTPQMQSVSAEVSLSGEVTTTIGDRLAQLAADNNN